MKSRYACGSPCLNSSQRVKSTPDHVNAVLMQCWTLPPLPSVSESVTNAPPACAITSRSPVASTTTLARIALRPCLLSKIAPLTSSPSVIAATTHECSSTRTPAPTSISCEAIFSHSGSIIGRLADRVAEGGEPLAPVGDLVGIGRSPQIGPGARDGVLGETVEQLGPDARDDLGALPVGHPVDPDHETARGEAAEIAVALDDGDPLPEAPRRDRRRRAGRASADDEHVGLLVDGDLAGRLADRRDRRWGGGRGGGRVRVATLGEPCVPAGEVALRVGLALCSVSIHHDSKGCRSVPTTGLP